jgi:hypothetical protein
MKTIEEAWDIIESLNDDAHNQAWDTWVESDNLMESDDEADWEAAEDLREQASLEQAEYFRDAWYDLSNEDQELIEYWLERDEDFREQFSTYFGQEEFANEFPAFEIQKDE